jgi:flagellar biosynthetic protein FliR
LFDFVNFAADKLQLFLLVMLRASGLFLIAPLLSNRMFPSQVKIGMVVLMGIILVPTLQQTSIPAVMSLSSLLTVAAKELLVGLSIGFVFSLLITGVQAAGDVVSYQIGFSMAQTIDPTSGTEITILGQFWVLLASVLFLALNGHHLIISAFKDSYDVIPAAQVSFNATAVDLIVTYSAYVFVIGLKIAAPVVVTLLLTDVAMGTLSRLMPTMNVFILGFGVKTGVGLAVTALSLPVFAYVLEKSTTMLNNELARLLTSLGKA